MHTNRILILITVLAMLSFIPLGVMAQGLNATNATDWPQTNYDPTMSRHSPQTEIGKNNVDQLQVKWILNTKYSTEAPPLIVGDTGYVENNGAQVIAFDLNTGLVKWFYDTNLTLVGGAALPRVSTAHGMTYENGVIYAPTVANGTIVALSAENGTRIWESPKLQNGSAWRISAPPLICNDIIIAGSALGDDPPFGFPARGSVTGVSKENGSILWRTYTAVGSWVTGPNSTYNG
ncbi:MAG TPA: PQQ-binding-like beta-propeller repeat protein, partial [Methanomicrobiales archaeon]|nr:PQQ-binding-like beta-propeller repeat protein [Methanomicrobiales archaeon]